MGYLHLLGNHKLALVWVYMHIAVDTPLLKHLASGSGRMWVRRQGTRAGDQIGNPICRTSLMYTVWSVTLESPEQAFFVQCKDQLCVQCADAIPKRRLKLDNAPWLMILSPAQGHKIQP